MKQIFVAPKVNFFIAKTTANYLFIILAAFAFFVLATNAFSTKKKPHNKAQKRFISHFFESNRRKFFLWSRPRFFHQLTTERVSKEQKNLKHKM
jgi:hypothetical protein